MSQPLPENPPETASAVGPGHPPVEHQFEKGRTGNPGGRPKGLARKVREVMGDDDGEALAGFWTGVMSGWLLSIHPETNERKWIEVEVKDRIAVSKLMGERGWGKPAQFVPIEDADPLDFSDADAVELAESFDARLDELAERRRQRAQAEQKPEPQPESHDGDDY